MRHCHACLIFDSYSLHDSIELTRAKKHYQPNTVSLPQPDPSVFASLNDLETLMRATLGAMANFNEDEKMILLK